MLALGGTSDLGREEDRMEDPVAKEDLERRRVMLGCPSAEGHSQQTLVKRRS